MAAIRAGGLGAGRGRIHHAEGGGDGRRSRLRRRLPGQGRGHRSHNLRASHGVGRQLRVYANRIEIETVFGSTKTVPMRQIREVKLGALGTRLTLKTSAGDFEFVLLEAQEIERAIRENM